MNTIVRTDINLLKILWLPTFLYILFNPGNASKILKKACSIINDFVWPKISGKNSNFQKNPKAEERFIIPGHELSQLSTKGLYLFHMIKLHINSVRQLPNTYFLVYFQYKE